MPVDLISALSLVIDNGSEMLKAGISGEDTPRTTFHCTVGRPKYPSVMMGMRTKDCYVGDETRANKGLLCIKHPVVNGMVTNWDDMEKIWYYTFDKLRADPANHPLLLTEPPLNPKSNREIMLQLLFETFNVPAAFVALPGVLSLYASGRTTGLIFDSGHGVTHTIPIYDGYALPNGIQRFNFAGDDVTNYLSRILSERGYSFLTPSRKEIARKIKEKLCIVSMEYEYDLLQSVTSKIFDTAYKLPDGQTIVIGNERFRAPEILFNPTIVNSEVKGIHEQIYDAIVSCDEELRKELCRNIVLSGGNTLFHGLAGRLHQEIQDLIPSTVRARVISAPERKINTWVGGSIVASLECFRDLCVSRLEYDECGPSIVHRKCI